MVYAWELEFLEKHSTNEIKNWIWMNVECNLATPGNVSVEAMRTELKRRGEEPVGYHNT